MGSKQLLKCSEKLHRIYMRIYEEEWRGNGQNEGTLSSEGERGRNGERNDDERQIQGMRENGNE